MKEEEGGGKRGEREETNEGREKEEGRGIDGIEVRKEATGHSLHNAVGLRDGYRIPEDMIHASGRRGRGNLTTHDFR